MEIRFAPRFLLSQLTVFWGEFYHEKAFINDHGAFVC